MQRMDPLNESPSVSGSARGTAWPDIEDFLRARGADRMPHPGGTLLQHLRRVAHLLGEWGADPTVQVAGLCHAAYGTDGFAATLLDVTERPVLAQLIGERAEALVHLYASCDRQVVYPRLGSERPIRFRNRYTGQEHTPPEPDVRAFLEITAANELDVVMHHTDLAQRYGPSLHRLFARSYDLLSAAARDACEHHLGRYANGA
ncbi:DUF6817 domain-containing protein [Streptomyces sp. NPDC001657]|uniref:DUF6817 domain-containing protein n=1 Tax=Streptomyces sp. NPDC001657 TaxID=3154522 RepID=UPI003324F7AE